MDGGKPRQLPVCTLPGRSGLKPHPAPSTLPRTRVRAPSNRQMTDQLTAFQRLLTIMDELREQCPWDRKQTFLSLRKLTIEETYELADELLKEDLEGVKEEVGDLLLHMVFYARIASEQGAWDIADALNAICDKLIERHPHIYGDVVADDAEAVKQNWEKIKLAQGKGKKTVLSGVPTALPAMIKALRMQEKTAQFGFDWDNVDQVWDKVREEMEEFRSATDERGKRRRIRRPALQPHQLRPLARHRPRNGPGTHQPEVSPALRVRRAGRGRRRAE